MEESNVLKDYPRPCHEKIPNFKGCEAAANKVARLQEFLSAEVIKVNPSLAQMHLRYLILKSGKTLVVPSPALTALPSSEHDADVFFYKIDGENLESNNQMKKASTKAGAVKFGSPLLLDWTDVPKIDVVVVASVAVGLNGVRLGKGLGYAELEWGILVELGVVNERTVVITTVHESQIVDDLTLDLMSVHDLPVDIIVTPKRIINVRKRLQKPMCGVLWDQISDEKLKEIPILRILKNQKKL